MLVLTLLLGCAHLSEPGGSSMEAPPESAVIGWRLVPGQELSYRYTVRLLRGDTEVSRTESWVYWVREVSPAGEALLEGRLTGLGTLVRQENQQLSAESLQGVERQERERLEEQTVWVRLSMDGYVVSVSGLAWEDALLHHSLALVFPEEPLQVGSLWPSPGTLAPYQNLMPPETEISSRSESRLTSYYSADGAVYASVEFEGEIQAGGEDLPQIASHGKASWDLRAGQLHERVQSVTLSQYSEAFGGRLLIETRREPQ